MVSSLVGSLAASQRAAPEMTVPVEPPNKKPRAARAWQARTVSVSSM
jgi:hypothetical protein